MTYLTLSFKDRSLSVIIHPKTISGQKRFSSSPLFVAGFLYIELGVVKALHMKGLHIKLKEQLLIEERVCSTILSVNSVHKFSEMCLSYSLNFTADK